MIETLTEVEKEMVFMLIYGQNHKGISDWLGINYSEYLKIKNSIFKKLKITRITKLLPIILKSGLNPIDF